MFRYYRFAFILILFFSVPASVLAISKSIPSDYDGMVHLKGTLVVPACTIYLGGNKQIIDMGSLKNTNFTAVGDLYVKKQFSLALDYCYSDMSVIFLGVTDDKDPMVFKVGETSESSKGIGLAIIDRAGYFIIPNTPYIITHNELGHKEISLYARYRSTSTEIKGGDANATISIFATYL